MKKDIHLREKVQEVKQKKKDQDTSGSKAAALVGAGIGLTTLGFSDTILDFLQPILDFLPNAKSSSVSHLAVGSSGWLGSWAFLYKRWKQRRKRIKTLLLIGGVLLILCVTGFLGGFSGIFK
jgi:hypothetical protein